MALPTWSITTKANQNELVSDWAVTTECQPKRVGKSTV